MALSSYDIRFILSVSDRTGNSLRRVAGDMRGVTADAARMKKAFAAMDVGRGLQLRGLLAGAGLGVAAQQAATFATSVTKAASQIAGDNSVQQIGQNTIRLQEQILDLMRQFPSTAAEQADAAYDIFSSMNVPLKQGVGLLKLFNMVAVAGATDLETASNAMITILNNFGGSWDKTMKAVNTSFAIIRFGRLEFSEFNDMLNQVIPAAKASGQSLQDVAGAMAFLTTRIPSQKQGATAIARLLEVISRPDFRKGATDLGLRIEDMTGKLKPLPEVIAELARLDISQVESTINSLIPVVTATGRGGGRGIQSTIQARKALILMVKDLKGYLAAQKNVTGATSEFEKRYASMIGSAGVKWERFKAQLQAMLIIVGAAVIPAFERLGNVVQRAIDWARQNRGTIEFIAKATLAAAVASLLAGTFLKLYGAALIVYTGLMRISMVTGGLMGMWGRFAVASDKLVGIVGRVAGALFLLGGRGAGTTAAMGGLATRVWLLITAVSTLNIAALRSASGMATFARATWLLITAVSTLNIAGARAALSLVPLAGMLARFAKIGVITIGINVILNFMKKEKREKAWFFAKRGMLGSALSEMMFGTDFGMSKWFATKDTKKAIADFEKKQKLARGPGMSNIAEGIQSDTKKMLNQIKRDLKGLSGDIFNDKMFKDLGLDPQSINDQVNKMLNQPGRTSQKDQQANRIVERTQELLKTASDKLIEVYQGFRDTNQQAFGEFFAGPLQKEGEEAELRKQWNWSGVTGDLLGKMQAQLTQFRKWRKGLDTLLHKGFSKDFVDEMRKLGPEGLEQIEKLKKASPGRVKQFNQVMKASKAEITKATEIDFNKQLAKWNSFGKDTAFKIIAGLESEEQNLQKRMTGVVERLYGAVARTIAEQQVKLEFAVPDEVTVNFGVAPKAGQPEPKGPTAADIRTSGYQGRYAIPAAMALRGGTPFGSLGGIPAWAIAAAATGPGMGRMPPVASIAARTQAPVTFNVNGTFLTPKEMMDAALNQSAHKLRNKR